MSAGQFERTKDAAKGVERMPLRASGRPIGTRKNGERSPRFCFFEHAQGVEARTSKSWSVLQGAERHAMSFAGAADAGYRDCSCRSAEREAEWRAQQREPCRMPSALTPNPSFEARPNGKPPGPGR